MLDRQIEAFASRDRFLYAVLGLVGWTERIEALAATPSGGNQPIAGGSLTEFLLGLLSFGRSVRATIDCDSLRALPEQVARQIVRNGEGDPGLGPPVEPRILR